MTFASLIAAFALLVSACGGGYGGSAQPAPTGDGTPTARVSISEVDGVGPVLVDQHGIALYSADEEAGGMVLCTGSCTSFWDPVVLPNGIGKPMGAGQLAGKLGTTERPDGARQVTFDGTPLYRFAEDTGPGVVSGDGFTDSFDGQEFDWHVATPSGASTPTSSPSRGFGY
jgi:predicted lipoprotein with Yx(FWY)xxD motif